MSTPPTATGTVNFADTKAFYNTYIDHRRGVIFFACLLLFFGLVVYLQVCGAECSGSDPSGLVGSSVGASNGDGDTTNTLNGTATGCLMSVSIICVLLGAGALMYYYSVVRQSHKLIDANLPYAAALINLEKGKQADTNLLAYQTALFQQQVINAGVDPASLCDNPYAKPAADDDSDTASETTN